MISSSIEHTETKSKLNRTNRLERPKSNSQKTSRASSFYFPTRPKTLIMVK